MSKNKQLTKSILKGGIMRNKFPIGNYLLKWRNMPAMF